MFSISGCASKSEYDKLMDKNKALEQLQKDTLSQQAELKKVVSTREMEIKDLKNQLKTATVKAAELQNQLSKIQAELNALKK